MFYEVLAAGASFSLSALNSASAGDKKVKELVHARKVGWMRVEKVLNIIYKV